jgi:hypothetical protein
MCCRQKWCVCQFRVEIVSPSEINRATHVNEMLVLRLQVQLSVERRELEAFPDSEHALFAHLEQERVVFRFGPVARLSARHPERRWGQPRAGNMGWEACHSQVRMLQVDNVDEQRVVPNAHQNVMLERERILLQVDDFFNREADKELLEVLHCRVDFVDELPEALEERECRRYVRAAS